MPYTVSARSDAARQKAEDLLVAAGLTHQTAKAIAKRLSWSLARAVMRELEIRYPRGGAA